MAGPYALDDLAQYIGLAKEVTPGTGIAPTLFLPFSGDVTGDHNMDGDDVYEGGTGPYEARAVKTKQRPHGTFTVPWKPSTVAKLMAWFLGQDAVATAGSLFDHTASPLQAPVYVSTEWNAAGPSDLTERFNGGVLSKLTIDSPAANGEIMVTCDFQARDGAIVSVATPSYETGIHGSTPGAAFRPSDCTFTLNNVTVTNIVSWKLELDWTVDDNIFTSTWKRAAFVKKKLTAKLTVRILELTVADYKQINYGASGNTATVADFFRGTTTAWGVVATNGLATTNLRTATLSCPLVDWQGAPRKITSQGNTSILEMTGALVKPAGDIVTLVTRNADTSAY